MALRGYLAGEVAEDYADGLVSRREALRRLGLLGLGLTSATTILAACGGDDDGGESSSSSSESTSNAEGSDSSGADSTESSSTTPTTRGAPVTAEPVTFDSPVGALQAAVAIPAAPKGAVLVVHENRGLTPHFFDLVGRLATDGYAALCVDLLSSAGGTASLTDEAAVQAALGEADMETLLATLSAGIDELELRAPGVKIGTVGFCFGGAMVWNMLQAGDSRLSAASPFYGPAPPSPEFSRADAAVFAVYAGNDDRVNASREEAVAALEASGLTYKVKTFEGVDHAFFNDTGPRYDEAAATEAYALLLDWFGQHLA
jgi:carboxymethylenebutenolidase